MDLLKDQEAIRGVRAHAQRLGEYFQLPLRNRAWRGQSGEMLGMGTGNSLDFQDHRSYVPGDDPRHINWQAYARSGAYTMKLYRQEARPVIDVVVDVSASMFFEEAKAQRSLELLFLVVEGAMRVGASVKCYLVCADQWRYVPDESWQSLHWADDIVSLQTKEEPRLPELNQLPLRPSSLRYFISDLLFPESSDKPIHSLHGRGGKAVILAPYSKLEADPDWQGNYDFIDAERQTTHPYRIERALLERYHEAYRQHFEWWDQLCRKNGVVLARVSSDNEMGIALQADAIRKGAFEVWT